LHGYDDLSDQRTLYRMVPLELERLKKHEEYESVLDAGIEFVPTCPLVYLTVRGDGLKNVLTDTPPTF
jgi:hypothetical protein